MMTIIAIIPPALRPCTHPGFPSNAYNITAIAIGTIVPVRELHVENALVE